jgi:hypothetical protein
MADKKPLVDAGCSQPLGRAAGRRDGHAQGAVRQEDAEAAFGKERCALGIALGQDQRAMHDHDPGAIRVNRFKPVAAVGTFRQGELFAGQILVGLGRGQPIDLIPDDLNYDERQNQQAEDFE